ncbi:hypothetical protein J6590_095633 [Homalodisca vitripennis]|nr:hypothetical protein J6590_095633 [Homalodisca vitripennis]
MTVKTLAVPRAQCGGQRRYYASLPALVPIPGVKSVTASDLRRSTKRKKEVKKGKKRVQTYPKALWSPFQALSLHRMQVPTTNHKFEDHKYRLQWDIDSILTRGNNA